jgi:cation diffusion facilitator family transporter
MDSIKRQSSIVTDSDSDHDNRDVQVRRVILIEGTANLAVLIAKAVVGTSTGSFAILADALHSLADLFNNLVAWFVVRLSQAPADREHPYGHRKYEVLAVFGLAALLTVLAVEIALGAVRHDSTMIGGGAWALGMMSTVLLVNIGLTIWQRRRAARLESIILRADADHTLSDVLTTIAVIAGWQVSIRGYPWLDTVVSFGVAGLVLYLAWGLFKKAIPVLVDEIAIEPEAISRTVFSVRGVRAVSRVRSRWVGNMGAVDLVVRVDPDLSTMASHEIADAVEDAVSVQFGIDDITVHIEPEFT